VLKQASGAADGMPFDMAAIFRRCAGDSQRIADHADDPRWGKVGQVSVQPKFSETLVPPPLPAPNFGRHTDQILGKFLGYDAKRIVPARRRCRK
jgi:crotonobetainyl-CoA:carnitine CoA-transferase CaiB-like acyl-CoA transferase